VQESMELLPVDTAPGQQLCSPSACSVLQNSIQSSIHGIQSSMAVQGPSERSEEAEAVVFSGDLKDSHLLQMPMAEVMEFSYIHPPPQARETETR